MAHPTHTPHSRNGLRQSRSILRPGHDPAVRQEAVRLVRAALQKSGFDLEKYAEFKRREIAAVQEALAKLRASADERAPAMRNAVARSTEYWVTANNALSPGQNMLALSTADHISVDQGFEFISQNIAPWANSAQVKLDKRSDEDDVFDGLVTFTFSFENQTGAGNLFRVDALLGVTAHCDVTADGWWNPSNYIWGLGPPSSSSLLVSGRLGIIEIVDTQVTIPPEQPDQSQNILPLGVTGDFGGIGTIAGQDLFRTIILSYSGLYVPANGRVEFDIGCEVNWTENGGGGCQFLATGNGRQVTAPGVFVATQPWIIT